jgi:hypothetical protein
VLAAGCASSATPPAAQTAARTRFDIRALQPVELEYRVTAQGRPAGRSVSTLTREADGWKRSVSLEFGPVRQTIDARWTAAWQPLTYAERYAGSVAGRVDARVENGMVVGDGVLPGSPPQSRTYRAATMPGTAWDQMEDAMLSTATLAPGDTLSIPVFNSSTGQVFPVAFRVGQRESVTVAAGTFEAFRVHADGGSSPLVMWLRVESPHLLVRQEVVGRPLVVELVAIRQPGG